MIKILDTNGLSRSRVMIRIKWKRLYIDLHAGLYPQRAVPGHPVPAAVNLWAISRPQLHHQSLSQRNVRRGVRQVQEGCQAQRLKGTPRPL